MHAKNWQQRHFRPAVQETTSSGLRDATEYLSMVTIEENETTKRLAAWAGIFAVATALAGIWGMNFKNMPELQWQYGYPAALAFITTVCTLLFRRFKKSGWL